MAYRDPPSYMSSIELRGNVGLKVTAYDHHCCQFEFRNSSAGCHPCAQTLRGGTHKRNTLLDVRNCMLLAFYVPPIVLPSSRYLPEMNRSWTSPLILNKTPVSRRVSDNLAQAKCFVKGISSFAIHVVTCKRLKKGTYQISQAYYGHVKTALLTRLHAG